MNGAKTPVLFGSSLQGIVQIFRNTDRSCQWPQRPENWVSYRPSRRTPSVIV